MPVCKGCGSSYDDAYEFCPYCGQRKPEPETVRLQVEVSESDKWEICEIHRHVYREKLKTTDRRMFGSQEGYLYATAVGPRGMYRAGVSPIYVKKVEGTVTSGAPKTETTFSGDRPAHTLLVNQLIRDGWEAIGRGTEWWQHKFRRRLGPDYPSPWITWELNFRSALLSETYFYLRRGPTGQEKSRVVGPRSEGWRFRIFGKPETTDEQRLDQFIQKLESAGYEPAPPSANELGKRCYDYGSSYGDPSFDTYMWFYRIFLERKGR